MPGRDVEPEAKVPLIEPTLTQSQDRQTAFPPLLRVEFLGDVTPCLSHRQTFDLDTIRVDDTHDDSPYARTRDINSCDAP